MIKKVKFNFKLDIMLALIILILLVAAPLIQILLKSIIIEGQLDIKAPFRIIKEGNLYKMFLNTLVLGISVVIGATVFALPMAYVIAKTEIGNKKWIDIILLVPFMTPPYIGSMGWILFMQPMGFLNQLFPGTIGKETFFFSFFGLVIIMSLHLFPFIYLILKNTLETIGGVLEEAAIIHGAGFCRRVFKVILPLLLSSYISGSLLVFIKTIGEFGTPATFGRNIGFKVLTTQIHTYVSSWPISFEKATSICYFLLSACILIWYIQLLLSKKYTYKTIGGKGSKLYKRKLNIVQKILCYVLIFFTITISIGIPYFSIISTSLIKLRGYGLEKDNFTFEHYIAIFEPKSKSLEAFITSLKISIGTASLCVIIGIFLSLVIVYNKGYLSKIIDLLSLLPNTIPAIVLVIGIILFWNSKFVSIPVYNTVWMVIITYVIFFIPYSVQYIKSSLSQINNTLLEAGEIFGASKVYIFRKILLPLIIPGIVAGWTMTFTIAFRELVGALMILPPGMVTSSTYIFGQFEQGEASKGMAMAVISVVITISILIILNIFVGKRVNDRS